MKTIMFTEDDHITTKVWSRLFKKRGYECIPAHNFFEALDTFNHNNIDLIILDLRLNGITHTGIDVYDYIRSKCGSNIPIVFLTGLDKETYLFKEAIERINLDTSKGVYTDLFLKPRDFEEIYPIIKEKLLI